MEEMVYGFSKRLLNTLARGRYHGFQYWILNLCTHPTAYVEIPWNHPYYNKDYDDCDVLVHGGLTYADSGLSYWEYNQKYNTDVLTRITDTWILGWDYNHYNDYTPYFTDGKNHSTSEILNEVKYVIKQLEVIK